jgi:hypothetical protein
MGVRIAKTPREHGRFADAHAKLRYLLGGGNRDARLGKHEADQIALVMSENERKPKIVSRFVTAHMRLRRIVLDIHPELANTVVPPVALAHLISAVKPVEVPPSSLRELTFDEPGVQVAEALFGVVKGEWEPETALGLLEQFDKTWLAKTSPELRTLLTFDVTFSEHAAL